MQIAYSRGRILDLIKEKGVEAQWNVDSAAIGGWHVGSSPGRRATSTLKKHNIEYNGRCRQVCIFTTKTLLIIRKLHILDRRFRFP